MVLHFKLEDRNRVVVVQGLHKVARIRLDTRTIRFTGQVNSVQLAAISRYMARK
jgi:hypothetical protein